MLFSALLAMATPLAAAPERFYEPEYSDEASAIFAAGDETPAEETRAALEALAREGDVSALEVLGEIHMFGLGAIARDPAIGCDYFEQVGDRRADSLHNLASCYSNGDGRPQDYGKARTLYRKAAEAGWRMSFCAYGKMLLLGQGGAADPAEGVRLCQMTALLGDKNALADYGTFLLTGQGAERDPVTARFMLERAAEQDQPNAAFLLGRIHIKGDGTPPDPAMAAQWFEKAWDGGRSDAAEQVAASYLRLGYTREDDERVTLKPAYLRKARSWYETALAAEPPGSERHGKIAAVIPAITTMIEDAEGSGGN